MLGPQFPACWPVQGHAREPGPAPEARAQDPPGLLTRKGHQDQLHLPLARSLGSGERAAPQPAAAAAGSHLLWGLPGQGQSLFSGGGAHRPQWRAPPRDRTGQTRWRNTPGFAGGIGSGADSTCPRAPAGLQSHSYEGLCSQPRPPGQCCPCSRPQRPRRPHGGHHHAAFCPGWEGTPQVLPLEFPRAGDGAQQ